MAQEPSLLHCPLRADQRLLLSLRILSDGFSPPKCSLWRWTPWLVLQDEVFNPVVDIDSMQFCGLARLAAHRRAARGVLPCPAHPTPPTSQPHTLAHCIQTPLSSTVSASRSCSKHWSPPGRPSPAPTRASMPERRGKYSPALPVQANLRRAAQKAARRSQPASRAASLITAPLNHWR